ncbi:MAG TPA: hypothetical protein VFV54_02275 [Thermoanaerobaculia bacterium]|nr:hypothetical protein [Thermoanaerobaculia bacterium]
MDNETTSAPASGADAQTKGSKAERAKAFVGEKVASAGEAAKKTYGTVKGKVAEADMGAMLEQVRAYVRENPGKALLMSVGAGFLLGLLLRRGDDEE